MELKFYIKAKQMNYLAHLFLTRHYLDDILGNYLADMMTKEEIDGWPIELQEGIHLHRFIDHFTDIHPVNRIVKRTLSVYFRKYAGVALDLYYDYFLYQNWDSYSQLPFSEFTQQQYGVIKRLKAHIPQRLRYTVDRMIQNDFLYRFTTLDGQSYAFASLDHRASFPTGFERAVEVLETHQEEINLSFNDFFPELMQAVDQYHIDRPGRSLSQ